MNYVLSKTASLWEMKPVQTIAKSVCAGTLGIAAYTIYSKFLVPDSNFKNIVAVLPNDAKVKDLHELEPEFIDFLNRLETFQRFDPAVYTNIFESMLYASNIKKEAYEDKSSSGLGATKTFQIRSAYQKIIENIRIFRAVIELRLPTALDDFDEIAVDINAKVESVCLDALHDSFL